MQPYAHTPARLFDGVHARARAGTAHLLGDALVFRDEAGGEDEWNLSAIRSIRRVARELHVEIGIDGAAVPLELVATDPAFEAQLDASRARFTLSAHAGVGARLRRLGVKGWLIIAAAVVPLAWIGYTVALPYAHVLISRKAEADLGEKLHDAMIDQREIVADEGLETLCARMVRELRDPEAGFDIRVTVLDEDEPNALAAPGGRILLFSGLLRLCPSADALAGVLAHEIVHVEQRHGLKHLLRSFGVLLFAGSAVGGGIEEFATAEAIAELSSGLMILEHSRENENEADALAIHKLQRAGRKASGLREFFAALEKEMPGTSNAVLAWVGTHPLTADRIAAVERLAGSRDASARPWMAPEEWRMLRARLLR